MKGGRGDGRPPGPGWAGSPAIAAPPGAGRGVIRADVVVHGAGWLGSRLAARLGAAGVDVACASIAPDPFERLILPCHPEHPHRFAAALGARAAAELLGWAAPARLALEGLHVIGIDVPCPGAEAELVPQVMQAAAAIGLAVERTEGGYRLLGGGHLSAAAGPGEDADARVEGELHVWAAPDCPADAWFDDKVGRVRWHGVPLPDPVPPRCSRQFSVFALGGWMWGARWAEPHFGIGDGPETPPSAPVLAALARLAEQDFGRLTPPGGGRTRTVGESCDGLPIVGPLPGRPRHIALTGFGTSPGTFGPAAVDAVAAGILGEGGAALPRALSAARFL